MITAGGLLLALCVFWLLGIALMAGWVLGMTWMGRRNRRGLHPRV